MRFSTQSQLQKVYRPGLLDHSWHPFKSLNSLHPCHPMLWIHEDEENHAGSRTSFGKGRWTIEKVAGCLADVKASCAGRWVWQDQWHSTQHNATWQPGTVHQIPSEKKKNNRHILPFLMKLGIGLLPQLHIARARMHVALISVEFIRQRFIFARRDCLPSWNRNQPLIK